AAGPERCLVVLRALPRGGGTAVRAISGLATPAAARLAGPAGADAAALRRRPANRDHARAGRGAERGALELRGRIARSAVRGAGELRGDGARRRRADLGAGRRPPGTAGA